MDTQNENNIETQALEPVKKENFFLDILKFTIIALVFVIPIRVYIAQPFIVSGSSMDPTFLNGEYLIIDEISYRLNDPERLDVIVFKFPEDTSKFFIKRIIGLPGETVEILQGKVTIKNSEFPEGFSIDEPYIKFLSSHTLSTTLSDDEYFVLGDNRPSSSDSRYWGALNEDLIVGRTLLRLLPISRVDIFPGFQTE